MPATSPGLAHVFLGLRFHSLGRWWSLGCADPIATDPTSTVSLFLLSMESLTCGLESFTQQDADLITVTSAHHPFLLTLVLASP